MPSSLSHAMAAVAIGSAMAPRQLVRPFVVAGAVCAVLPDLDGIGQWWYGAAGEFAAIGGHRGFTHSLTYAAMCGIAAPLLTFGSARWRGVRARFGVFIALATASHGMLDALTTIGATTSPVQFLSPFDTRGSTFPWKPIQGPFSELFLLLLPLAAVSRVVCHLRGIAWPGRGPNKAVTLDLS